MLKLFNCHRCSRSWDNGRVLHTVIRRPRRLYGPVLATSNNFHTTTTTNTTSSGNGTASSSPAPEVTQPHLSAYIQSPNSVLKPKLSPTHRGTAFENRCVDILQKHLSMSLRRVGGANDGGIDLVGWWWLPDLEYELGCSGFGPSSRSNSQGLAAVRAQEKDATPFVDQNGVRRKRIRVIAQCKAEKKKLGPNYVREMEGVMYRYMHDPSLASAIRKRTPESPSDSATEDDEYDGAVTQMKDHIVGLFLSESAFSKATLLRMVSSRVPFLLCHIPPLADSIPGSEEDAAIGSAVWNAALSGQKGLLGGQLELRWEHSLQDGTQTPSLWHRGKRLNSWTPGLKPRR
jgi:hypothetical protein